MIKTPKTEFQKNRDILKTTKRLDQLLCVFYFIICFPTFLFSAMRMFLFGLETIFLLIFGVAASVAIFFLGYWGFYKKNIIFSALSTIVTLSAALICSALDEALGSTLGFLSLGTVGGFNFGTAISTALLIPINMYNTAQFNYVKQQPGYPYFNDLIEKQKEEQIKNNIKTEYESTYERITQNKVTRIDNNVYSYEKSTSQPTTMDEL